MNPLIVIVSQTLPRGKPDIVEPFVGRTDPIGGLVPALQVVGSLLLVVVLLKYALPKVLARWGSGKPPASTGSFKVEETIPFAGGHLYVVTVRGRSLLLAGGATGVRFLTELADPAASGDPAFFELLDEAKNRPDSLHAAVMIPDHPEPDEDESKVRARQALNRLRRIAQ